MAKRNRLSFWSMLLVLMSGLLPSIADNAGNAMASDDLSGENIEQESHSFSRRKRVAGGVSDGGQLDMVVSLRIAYVYIPLLYWSGSSCSAISVGSGWVLTARHCVMDSENKALLKPEQVEVDFDNLPKSYSGSYPRLPVNEILLPPNGFKDDIALLRLKHEKVVAVRPPSRLNLIMLTQNDINRNAEALVIGYGDGKPENETRPHRRKVKIASISRVSRIRTLADKVRIDVTEGTGSGDSGSPLIYENKIVGTLSGGGSYEKLAEEGGIYGKNVQNWFLTSMGLQFFYYNHYSSGIDRSELFQLPGGEILCKAFEEGFEFPMFGTVQTEPETNKEICEVHYQPWKLTYPKYRSYHSTSFQVAYKPYIETPWDAAANDNMPPYSWQPLNNGKLPDMAIPVGFNIDNRTGKKSRYLCLRIPSGVGRFDDYARFPGFLHDVESGCQNLKPEFDSDNAVTMILSAIPDVSNNDRNMMPHFIRSPDVPCYLETQQGVKVGLYRKNPGPVCALSDGTEHSYHYVPDFPPKWYFLDYPYQYVNWQTASEAFYDYTYGAVKYTGPRYVGNRQYSDQSYFCRYNGTELGVADLSVSNPVCGSTEGTSTPNFELFSRTLPLPDTVRRVPSPDWHMLMTGNNGGRKTYVCNGVKVNDWLVAVSRRCIENRTMSSGYQYTVESMDNQNDYPVKRILYPGGVESHYEDSGSAAHESVVFLVTRTPMTGRSNVPLSKEPFVDSPHTTVPVTTAPETGSITAIKAASTVDSTTEWYGTSANATEVLGTSQPEGRKHYHYLFAARFKAEGDDTSARNYSLIEQPTVDAILELRQRATDCDRECINKSWTFCPLDRHPYSDGLGADIDDTLFVTVGQPLISKQQDQWQLIGLGVSLHCNNIVTGSEIDRQAREHVKHEVKLVIERADPPLGDGEPCWSTDASFKDPDGYIVNGQCSLFDRGISHSSTYLLPTDQYQWQTYRSVEDSPDISIPTFGLQALNLRPRSVQDENREPIKPRRQSIG